MRFQEAEERNETPGESVPSEAFAKEGRIAPSAGRAAIRSQLWRSEGLNENGPGMAARRPDGVSRGCVDEFSAPCGGRSVRLNCFSSYGSGKHCLCRFIEL